MFAYPVLIVTCLLGQTPAPAGDKAPPKAQTAAPADAGTEQSPPAAPPPPDDTGAEKPAAPAATGTADTPPAPAAPAAPEGPKKRLLVLNLVDKGAGPEVTQALTDAVSKQAAESYIGEVVTPKDVETEVQRGELQMMAGCDSDNCAFSLGTLVDAERVLAGNVAKVGADYLITLLVVDVGSGKREAFEQRKVPAFNELYFYAAKQLTAIALTGQSVDFAVPVMLEFSEDVDPKVLVDGKEGQLQGKLVMLDPGSHEIKVEAAGYETWKTSIDVKAGQPMSLRVEFVSSRIPLWPVTITLAGVGVVLAAIATPLYIVAHGRMGTLHDTPVVGGIMGGLFDRDETYLYKKPASSAFLSGKQSEVFLFAVMGDALIGTAVVAELCAAGVLTADVVWWALAE